MSGLASITASRTASIRVTSIGITGQPVRSPASMFCLLLRPDSTTSWLSFIASARCRPRKPVPPVIRTRWRKLKIRSGPEFLLFGLDKAESANKNVGA